MWVYVLIGVVVFIGLFLVRGIIHIRQSERVALKKISEVTIDQIRSLSQECIEAFTSHFGETLDITNLEDAAQVFSNRLDDSASLKKAFGKDDFYWYCVLPTGAFLGELLRTHVNGVWHSDKEGAPYMKITVGDGDAETYPFEKILKHISIGDKGDIYAFIKSAQNLEKMTGQITDQV